MNNQSPLKFHPIHGKYVYLSRDGTIAKRFEGFSDAVVFSHRPIAVGEYIYIKFLDVSVEWTGTLRIGFTSTNPEIFCNDLPKYACPFMSDLPGNWAVALAENSVKEESVLFYYVNSDGNVYYGFDHVEKGVLCSGVDVSAKLWVLLDIYGNTIEIQFLNPSYLHGETYCIQNKHTSKNKLTKDLQCIIPVISFNKVCGKNVMLFEDRRIYEKQIGDNGYAFTNRVLQVKEILVIQVLDVDCSEARLTFGVTSCNPKQSGNFPNDPYDLLDRPDYWVVQEVKEVLSNSDIFVFFIRNDGALMVKKNLGRLSVSVYVDKTLPLWFFINLCNSSGKIIILGSYEGVIKDGSIDNLVEELKADSVVKSLSSKAKPIGEAETSNDCIICMELSKNCALYKCGHICMCYDCAKKILNSSNPYCPICRQTIQDVLKVYR